MFRLRKATTPAAKYSKTTTNYTEFWRIGSKLPTDLKIFLHIRNSNSEFFKTIDYFCFLKRKTPHVHFWQHTFFLLYTTNSDVFGYNFLFFCFIFILLSRSDKTWNFVSGKFDSLSFRRNSFRKCFSFLRIFFCRKLGNSGWRYQTADLSSFEKNRVYSP